MEITVKEFIRQLEKMNQDHVMYFGGLDFLMIENLADTVHCKFEQKVYKDENGVIKIIQ